MLFTLAIVCAMYVGGAFIIDKDLGEGYTAKTIAGFWEGFVQPILIVIVKMAKSIILILEQALENEKLPRSTCHCAENDE